MSIDYQTTRRSVELSHGTLNYHDAGSGPCLLMIHGSGPNTSDDRRIAVAIRCCTPQIAQQVAEKDYAILARGADRAGNFINFTPPRAPFTPESLALYDEIRTAQSQALMAGVQADRKGFYA